MKLKARLAVIFFTLIFFVVGIFCYEYFFKGPASGTDVRGAAYADPKTCIKCHSEVYQSYTHTAHFRTSAPITGNQLQADIVADSSAFEYNPGYRVLIERQADGVYQTFKAAGKTIISKKIDVAFGAGQKAQTYGYWEGDRLLELPLSYYKIIHNWATSPAFPPLNPLYDHEIISRCFECHGSNATVQNVQTGALATAQQYDKAFIIYGIDCQRCHGAAANHVNYHVSNPADKKAKYIATYQSLTREAKVSMCAVCHSGNDQKTTKPTFTYQPGDTLSRYYEPDFGMSDQRTPDVHGNQAKLLSMSKCFSGSSSMTCTTCHDTHKSETGDLVSFSQKCNTCHRTETHNLCKLAPTLGMAINNKCIDCHMPSLPSKVITYRTTAAKKWSHYLLRSHRIAVYPEQTQEILKTITKNNPQSL